MGRDMLGLTPGSLQKVVAAFPRLAAVALLTLSLLVIMQTITGVQRLPSALHFLLTAFLLFSLNRKAFMLSRIFSVLLAIVPLVTLLGWFDGMYIGTSSCFVLIALGTLLMLLPKRQAILLMASLSCFGVVFALGFVNLVAFILKGASAIHWNPFTPMAPLSSLLFVLSCLSLMILALQGTQDSAHKHLAITFLVLSSSLLLTFFGWQAAHHSEKMFEHMENSMSLSIALMGSIFSILIGILQHLYFKSRNAYANAAQLVQWNDAIVNGSQLAIIATDAQGLIKSMNPAAEKLLGYTANELVGKYSPAIWHDPVEIAERAKELSADLGQAIEPGFAVFTAKASHGVVDRRSWTYITKGGERRTVDLAVHALRDQHTAINGFVGIVEDITEQVRRNLQLEAALQKAEVATVAKSRFLASMSHEIRTPINGVMGMVQLMRDTKMDADQQVYAEAIQTCTENLLVIVNDILDLSKVEAGKLELEMTSFDLPGLLKMVEGTMGLAAAKKGLIFEDIIGADVPNHVQGDPTRIRQILLNLVSNAIKFTSTGKIIMKVGLMTRIGDQTRILFEVIDTGIGIPLDDQAKIFDPFVQADASTTRRFGGTGLGLSISRHLVQLMNGQMGVTSVINQGSRFWFVLDLPICQKKRETPGLQAQPVTEKLRILLVEDNAINQLVARKSLEKYGFALTVAVNGQEALDALQTAPYHLVLMDCEMPVMDGFEATRRIRSSGMQFQNIPIVAMTANAMAGDRDHCIQIGMNDYITKPFVIHDVVAIIQKAIKLHQEAA